MWHTVWCFWPYLALDSGQVRDSKDQPEGPQLRFTRRCPTATWARATIARQLQGEASFSLQGKYSVPIYRMPRTVSYLRNDCKAIKCPPKSLCGGPHFLGKREALCFASGSSLAVIKVTRDLSKRLYIHFQILQFLERSKLGLSIFLQVSLSVFALSKNGGVLRQQHCTRGYGQLGQ